MKKLDIFKKQLRKHYLAVLKFIVYILIFQFSVGACIPKNDFSQLLKLNDLADHYQLHVEEAKLEGETLTVNDFIYLHFLTEDDHQHNDQSSDHKKLPFKNISCSLDLQLTSFEYPAVLTPLMQKSSSFIFNDLLSAERSIRIFHPPLAIA